jgi:hypothetical protein
MHPVTAAVLFLACLLSFPFGIVSVQQANSVAYWRHNPTMLKFSIQEFAICFGALIIPWATFVSLRLLGPKPGWRLYSVLVLGTAGTVFLALLVAGILVMSNINLGP